MERETVAGVWEGALDVDGLETRVRLEVDSEDVLVDLVDLGVIATPLVDLELREDGFEGRLLGAIRLWARVDGTALRMHALDGAEVLLVRDDPRLRVLDVPRPAGALELRHPA